MLEGTRVASILYFWGTKAYQYLMQLLGNDEMAWGGWYKREIIAYKIFIENPEATRLLRRC
jgi:hypothetical protein